MKTVCDRDDNRKNQSFSLFSTFSFIHLSFLYSFFLSWTCPGCTTLRTYSAAYNSPWTAYKYLYLPLSLSLPLFLSPLVLISFFARDLLSDNQRLLTAATATLIFPWFHTTKAVYLVRWASQYKSTPSTAINYLLPPGAMLYLLRI
jgi:hypothetical protein